MNGKVSVIVPVYNVQEYVQQCVESIMQQTYTNLEILLIDDGATDNSGAIIDRLALEDQRIKVIHKTNGGLSSARNAGIDACTGDYIVFVDSDDYIGNKHIENMLIMLEKHDADISISSFVYSSSRKEDLNRFSSEQECYDKYSGIEQMLYAKEFSFSAPMKLYKYSLFNNIRFPVGELYEDMSTTYKIFLNANRIVYSNDITYCYYIRKGSIDNSPLTKKHIDSYKILKNYKTLIDKCPSMKKAINCQYLVRSLEFIKQIRWRQKEYKNIIWRFVKNHRKGVIGNPNVSGRIKAFALVSYFGYPLTYLVVKSYYSIKK